jgi:hypothetical protein
MAMADTRDGLSQPITSKKRKSSSKAVSDSPKKKQRQALEKYEDFDEELRINRAIGKLGRSELVELFSLTRGAQDLVISKEDAFVLTGTSAQTSKKLEH